MIGLEDIKCAVLGKCKVKEYEFYFYLNDEKIKADKCFSNLYGFSECTYNGKDYQNVVYESTLVNEYTKTNDFPLLPFLIIILGISLISFVYNLIMR